jgi:hypothetical protein
MTNRAMFERETDEWAPDRSRMRVLEEIVEIVSASDNIAAGDSRASLEFGKAAGTISEYVTAFPHNEDPG